MLREEAFFGDWKSKRYIGNQQIGVSGIGVIWVILSSHWCILTAILLLLGHSENTRNTLKYTEMQQIRCFIESIWAVLLF